MDWICQNTTNEVKNELANILVLSTNSSILTLLAKFLQQMLLFCLAVYMVLPFSNYFKADQAACDYAHVTDLNSCQKFRLLRKAQPWIRTVVWCHCTSPRILGTTHLSWCLWTSNKYASPTPGSWLKIHHNSSVYSKQHFLGDVFFARKHLASKQTGR